ncbi:cupin domain-containing protein [Agrococcus sp. HG114]|uniref:cupin domain-containing protein n=1 Tax=Agrococcus sp. HG114 TaxID=2969757 RepID=UPI00215AEBDB|nr:cupin domain-containing protein [Agrococcus sp. HG114]MCR8671969.1 cupin domain-containing protein [Agrococcus sp. HG114]
MDAVHLPTLADELLATAREATSGRAGQSTRSGRDLSLRQTVLALTADHGIDEHEANGEATLQVLSGRVRLRWGSESVELAQGDVVDIPDARHAVDALTDATLLLTVAMR